MNQRRKRWYAVARPTPAFFSDTDRPLGRMSVKVSSREEGELLLAGGIRLDPGLFVFTDAASIGGAGIGVVLVDMPFTDADPRPIWEQATSVNEVSRSAPIAASPETRYWRCLDG